MFDTKLHYLVANAAWIRDTSPGGNLRGHHRYEVSPDLAEHWKEADQRALAGETVQVEEELWKRPADGAEFWLRWSVRPWHTGKGALLARSG